eukprot:31177-Pelagococcus_subviridis.AAC.3
MRPRGRGGGRVLFLLLLLLLVVGRAPPPVRRVHRRLDVPSQTEREQRVLQHVHPRDRDLRDRRRPRAGGGPLRQEVVAHRRAVLKVPRAREERVDRKRDEKQRDVDDGVDIAIRPRRAAAAAAASASGRRRAKLLVDVDDVKVAREPERHHGQRERDRPRTRRDGGRDDARVDGVVRRRERDGDGDHDRDDHEKRRARRGPKRAQRPREHERVHRRERRRGDASPVAEPLERRRDLRVPEAGDPRAYRRRREVRDDDLRRHQRAVDQHAQRAAAELLPVWAEESRARLLVRVRARASRRADEEQHAEGRSVRANVGVEFKGVRSGNAPDVHERREEEEDGESERPPALRERGREREHRAPDRGHREAQRCGEQRASRGARRRRRIRRRVVVVVERVGSRAAAVVVPSEETDLHGFARVVVVDDDVRGRAASASARGVVP